MLAIDLKEIIEIVSNQNLKKMYPDILSLLKLSRKKFINPHDLVIFQEAIAEIVKHFEAILKKHKNNKIHNRAVKHTIRVMKWIMDGIALRLLGFNPNAYRILSDNNSSGHIETNKSYSTEIARLKSLAEEGKHAIMNDLTNFVRLGDIMHRHEGILKLEEVKSKISIRKKIKNKQEIKNEAAEKMINGNFCIIEGKPASIEIIPISSRTHLNHLKKLWSKSKKNGLVESEIIDDCLIFRLINNEICSEKGITDVKQCFSQGSFEGKRVIPAISLDLAYCKGDQFLRGMFPPSVFKLPCEMIADIMTGRVIVLTQFSLTDFYKKFEDHGFKVTENLSSEDLNPDEIFKKTIMPLEMSRPSGGIRISKDEWYCDLPSNAIGRILYEYITPHAFFEMTKYSYENRHKQPEGYVLSVFQNHRSLYR